MLIQDIEEIGHAKPASARQHPVEMCHQVDIVAVEARAEHVVVRFSLRKSLAGAAPLVVDAVPSEPCSAEIAENREITGNF